MWLYDYCIRYLLQPRHCLSLLIHVMHAKQKKEQKYSLNLLKEKDDLKEEMCLNIQLRKEIFLFVHYLTLHNK